MLFKKTLFAAFIFTTSVCAYAQEQTNDNTGWFVGGYLGHQSSELDDYGTYKNSDNAYGVVAGYNFTPWFGLESSFVFNNEDAKNSSTLRSTSFGNFSFTPKFTLPINDTFSLYAKAGLSSIAYVEEYKTRNRYSDNKTESWSGLGSTYGAGAEFNLKKGLKLRISYDYASATLEDNDDYYANMDANLTQTGLSLYYQF